MRRWLSRKGQQVGGWGVLASEQRCEQWYKGKRAGPAAEPRDGNGKEGWSGAPAAAGSSRELWSEVSARCHRGPWQKTLHLRTGAGTVG